MNKHIPFPIIDPIATGKNIVRLRILQGLSVLDLQAFFGFNSPQAIYLWQQGKTVPSTDHLLALSHLFGVSMNDILVIQQPQAVVFNSTPVPGTATHWANGIMMHHNFAA